MCGGKGILLAAACVDVSDHLALVNAGDEKPEDYCLGLRSK